MADIVCKALFPQNWVLLLLSIVIQVRDSSEVWIASWTGWIANPYHRRSTASRWCTWNCIKKDQMINRAEDVDRYRWLQRNCLITESDPWIQEDPGQVIASVIHRSDKYKWVIQKDIGSEKTRKSMPPKPHSLRLIWRKVKWKFPPKVFKCDPYWGGRAALFSMHYQKNVHHLQFVHVIPIMNVRKFLKKMVFQSSKFCSKPSCYD